VAIGGGKLTMGIHLRTNYPTRDIGREMDCEAIKRNAFKDQGIVVVSVNDPRLSWDQREILKQIGDKIYGYRYLGILGEYRSAIDRVK
jgi:hypothetical protein